MKSKSVKAFLCLTLSFVLVWGLFPLSVFAGEDNQTDGDGASSSPGITASVSQTSQNGIDVLGGLEETPTGLNDAALLEALESVLGDSAAMQEDQLNPLDGEAGGPIQAVFMVFQAFMIIGHCAALAEEGVHELLGNPEPGPLTKFFNPAKYFGVNILQELEEIQNMVNNINYEVDAINNKLNSLMQEIKVDNAYSSYRDAVAKVEPATERLDALMIGPIASIQTITDFFAEDGRPQTYHYTIDPITGMPIPDEGIGTITLSAEDEAKLAVRVNQFITLYQHYYGHNRSDPSVTIYDDISTLASALYNKGGLHNPSLVEAQLNLSAVSNTYEHAIIEDGCAVFMSLARYMYIAVYINSICSKFFDDEYLAFADDNTQPLANFPYKDEYGANWDDTTGPSTMLVESAQNHQDTANAFINDAAENCGIFDLLPAFDFGYVLDEDGNRLTDQDGNEVPALTAANGTKKDPLTEMMPLHGYIETKGKQTRELEVMRLRVFETHQEILVPVDSMKASDFHGIADYIRSADLASNPENSMSNRMGTPFYNDSLMSRDGRFVIPRGESEYYSLWPIDTTDVVEYFHDTLDINLPQETTSFLINDVAINEDSRGSEQLLYDYNLLDARNAVNGSPDSVKTVVDLCGNGTIEKDTFFRSYSGPSADLPVQPFFIDQRTSMSGWREGGAVVDNGAPGIFKPKDAEMGSVSLIDGDVLDLRELLGGAVLDCINTTIYVGGNVSIIGNPNMTLENLHIELLEGANLTLTDVVLKQTLDETHIAGIRALGKDAKVTLGSDIHLEGIASGVAVASDIRDYDLVLTPSLTIDLADKELSVASWECGVETLSNPSFDQTGNKLTIKGGTFKTSLYSSQTMNRYRSAIGREIEFIDTLLDLKHPLQYSSMVGEGCRSIGVSQYEISVENADRDNAGLDYQNERMYELTIVDSETGRSASGKIYEEEYYANHYYEGYNPYNVDFYGLYYSTDQIQYQDNFLRTIEEEGGKGKTELFFAGGLEQVTDLSITFNEDVFRPEDHEWMPLQLSLKNLYNTRADLDHSSDFFNREFFGYQWEKIDFSVDTAVYWFDLKTGETDLRGTTDVSLDNTLLITHMVGNPAKPVAEAYSVGIDYNGFDAGETATVVTPPTVRTPDSDVLTGFSFAIQADGNSRQWYFEKVTASHRVGGAKGATITPLTDQSVQSWITGESNVDVTFNLLDSRLYEIYTETADKKYADFDDEELGLFLRNAGGGEYANPRSKNTSTIVPYARGGDSDAFEKCNTDWFYTTYDRNVGQVDNIKITMGDDDWYPRYISIDNSGHNMKEVTFYIEFLLDDHKTYYFDIDTEKAAACVGADGQLDAAKVIALLETSQQEYVSFNVGKNVRVAKELLAYLKTANKNIILNVRDGDLAQVGLSDRAPLRWIVRGNKITDTTKDANLAYTLMSPSQAGLSHLAPDNQSVCIVLDHEGPLPGDFEMEVNLSQHDGFKPSGTTSLFHHDTSADNLRLWLSDIMIDDDQSVTFSVNHASTWVLIRDGATSLDKTSGAGGKIPGTGDTIPFAGIALLAVLGCAGITLIARECRHMRRERKNSMS